MKRLIVVALVLSGCSKSDYLILKSELQQTRNENKNLSLYIIYMDRRYQEVIQNQKAQIDYLRSRK